MGKNILLIYPQAGFEVDHINIYMPMSLMCLAAPLVKQGIEVTILDQRVEKDFFKKVKENLQKNPLCVGISAKTGTQIIYALECANFVRKNSKTPIVWGGVHASLTADQTIRDNNVDIIVRGEGEFTFQELIKALDTGKSFENIKGLTWKDERSVYHNPDREFCDMDSLELVPYHLIDIEKYIVPQVPGRSRCLNIYASRGCPRKCIFCYNTQFNKSTYRMKNIDKVLAEIEWLTKTYNLDSICINDDNFSVDIERTHYFCREMIKRKIVPEWAAKGMEIWRVAKMDFELLEKSGLRHVYMGIESGSHKVLKYLKRSDSPQGIKKLVDKFAHSKMIAHYNFIMGFPVEGENELFETIEIADYIRKTDPKSYCSSFHVFTPFPKTALTQIAMDKYGFKPPENLADWGDFRFESIKVPWISPKMRRIYSNICMITYFVDDKFSDKIKNNPVLKALAGIFSMFARWHWKHRKFTFCPEFKIIKWWADSKVHRKIAQIKKSCAIKVS